MQSLRRYTKLLALCSLIPCMGVAEDVSDGNNSQSRQTRIKIAKDTTAILEPLDQQGYPDYLAALNLLYKQGATTRSNAARSIYLTLRPDSLGSDVRQKIESGLEIAEQDQRHYFFTREDFVRETRPKSVESETRLILEQSEAALDRVWTAQEFPLLAEWLEFNREALAEVCRASQLPKWYVPGVAVGLPSVMLAPLPVSQQARTIAKALRLRALLRIGENEAQAAWDDILALHRLSLLQCQAPHLIERLVGFDIAANGFAGEQVLLQSTGVTTKLVERIRRDIANLPKMPELDAALDHGQRYLLLDAISLFAQHGLKASKLNHTLQPNDVLQSFHERIFSFCLTRLVNWNRVTRTMNQWVDRTIEAIQIKNDIERMRVLRTQTMQIRNMKAHLSDWRYWSHPRLYLPPVLRIKASIWMADQMVVLFFPDVNGSCAAHIRWKTRREIADIGWTLSEYRLKHNRFPEKLDSLVPELMLQVPPDRFADRPLRYQSDGQRFVIYSVGINQVNDECRTESDSPRGDDLVLRSHLLKSEVRIDKSP